MSDAVETAQDLLVVGAGHLGRRVVSLWRSARPDARIVAETRSTVRHQELRAAGATSTRVNGDDPPRPASNLLVALPPSQVDDYRMEWLLWLNSGLDRAYMAAGALLWERGLRKSSSRLLGYGQALLIQGGFLLLFDLTLVALNIHLNQGLIPRLVVGSGEHGAQMLGFVVSW